MADHLGSDIPSRPGRTRRSVLQLSAVITAFALITTGCGNRADTSSAAAQAPTDTTAGQTTATGTNPGSLPGGTTAVNGTVPAAGTPAPGTNPGAVATTAPGQQPAAGGGGGGKTSTGDGNATGGQKGPAANTGDCSKPIVIGSVGEYSGVLGSILTSGTVVVRSWAAAINATGGLHCHQVKYVVYDEGGDPSRAQSLTRKAVEEDKVIAFVYMGHALAGQAAVPYLQQKQIPVIGEEGGNAWSCKNSMYFPIMSSCDDGVDGNYQTLAKVVGKKDNKVAAITCVEVPYCAGYSDNAARYAKANGLDLVYNGSISLTQPDYTSSCLFAQRAGASMVVFGGDSTAMSRFLTSCKSVNYAPILAGPGSAFTPAAASVPELQGAWTASGVKFAPASDPAVAALLAVMKKYAPSEPLGPNGGIGWVSAQVFQYALRNVTGNPTSQDVLNGLWSIKNYDVGGMTRPLTFTKNGIYKSEPRCWFPVQIKNKQWVGSPKLCA
jgi:branched-chain amino acid transport system substrate-binding protein